MHPGNRLVTYVFATHCDSPYVVLSNAVTVLNWFLGRIRLANGINDRRLRKAKNCRNCLYLFDKSCQLNVGQSNEAFGRIFQKNYLNSSFARRLQFNCWFFGISMARSKVYGLLIANAVKIRLWAESEQTKEAWLAIKCISAGEHEIMNLWQTLRVISSFNTTTVKINSDW